MPVCLSVCLSVSLQLVMFQFPDLVPEKGNTHVFSAQDYDFRVFLMLSESDEIRDQKRVNFHSVQLTPKMPIHICFCS